MRVKWFANLVAEVLRLFLGMVKRRLEHVVRGGRIFIPLDRQGFCLDCKEIAVVMSL